MIIDNDRRSEWLLREHKTPGALRCRGGVIPLQESPWCHGDPRESGEHVECYQEALTSLGLARIDGSK